MKTFADSKGRQWRVKIDDAAIRRVRRSLGFDLRVMLHEAGFVSLGDLLKDMPLFANTFSAQAAAGLGASDTVRDAVKDQTKEAKKTNEKIDKTNRLLERGGRLT